MDKREKFIEKATKKHNGKYDYSKVEYVNSTTKICIICPIHGEFWQTPQGHVRGNSCPKCANIKRGDTFRSNADEFIEKASKIHNSKYVYDKTKYVNSNTKIPILCFEHGTFWMTPMNHLLGQGCPKCSGRGLNNNEIINMFIAKHGKKYDYSKVEFTKMHDKVCIICPEHGEFWQTPSKHLLGQGCPKCAIELRAEERNIGNEEFIKRARKIYGDEYIYADTKYTKMEDKVKIICPKHGEFWQKPYDHLHGHGCPKCGLIESKGENEIYEYICGLIGKENVEHSNREALNGYEIDIYIPKLQIGIEYNGLKWHSEKFKNRNYHLMKTNLANSKGIKLIQIFEDEYILHKNIVLSKIKTLIHANKKVQSIMGRKCSVQQITKDAAKSFLEKNHIQGYGRCTLALGCFNSNMLVGVMTFEQYGTEWLLNRFATDINFICQGIGGKLFSFFIKNYNPKIVKSFADRRWTLDENNNLYTKLGFKLDKVLKPEYRYVNSSHPTDRMHKFNFRKKILAKKYGVDEKQTETKLTESLGFYKIWDCGLLKYIWKNEGEH